MFPFQLAGIEAQLETSRQELRDISTMYVDAEESRYRHVVRYACIGCVAARSVAAASAPAADCSLAALTAGVQAAMSVTSAGWQLTL